MSVAVRDNGIGLAPTELSRIFEPYTQINYSLEKAQGGLGIGLTLVKRLVEMHDGRVEVKSDGPGHGAEFIVTLPVPVEAPSPKSPHEQEAQKSRTSSLRILIVDDNRDGADSLSMMLKMMGNAICTAYDGKEAIEEAERFRPDVILLDIGLPKLNGYEACRHIRDQDWGKNMILIATTGWGQDGDRRQSHEAGFDKHLVKPVNPAELMQLLSELSEVKR